MSGGLLPNDKAASDGSTVASPTGTVTFLFTDIEASTRRWEEDGAAMRDALGRHDTLLRSTLTAFGGRVFATGGDGFAVAFATAGDALACAGEAQTALQGAALPPVRMGIHTGEADERDGDYFGPAVNRAARLMSIAHGGQVLVSGVTAALVGSAGLVDLGEHRLRDLSRAEHVHQLVIDDLPSSFPPLRSLDHLPTNLGVQLTSFIGRGRDLDDLAALLRSHRLVTLTGVGGVGKTRLALQAAADRLTELSDGVWVCELAAAEDASALGEVVAVALSVVSRPGMSVEDSIVESLRAKNLLLVIDNCEHLLDPAAALVERILRECSGVSVLATSREGLGIEGEHLRPLRSLSSPDVSAPLHELIGNDSVQLFSDRALAVNPAFRVDERSAPAVAEICRRLDCIPLAIELAAARTAGMAPAEIAARLDERFRLLTGGRRRAVERHQTLRAAVDWSYSLLGERERSIFSRLGVFAGTFDASAAEAVASDDALGRFEVLDAVHELVLKSMVAAEHTDDGTTRYSLLETLRQYALELLDARRESDLRRRLHAEHYAATAEDIGPRLLGPDELLWRPRVRADLDNFRAAVGWALDGPDDTAAELSFRIIAGLARDVVLDRGAGIAGWAERALPLARRARPAHRAPLLTAVGFGRFHRGDFITAEALFREAIDIAQGDVRLDPTAIVGLANCMALGRGDVRAAISLLRSRPDVELGPAVGYDVVAVRGVTAIYCTVIGDVEGARAAASAASTAARAVGHPSALAVALYAEAMARAPTDVGAAATYCEESIALTQSGACDTVFHTAQSLLAELRWREGRVAESILLARDSLAYGSAVGDHPAISEPIVFAAAGLASTPEWEAAARAFGAVLQGAVQPFTRLLPDVATETLSAALEALRCRVGDNEVDLAMSAGAAMSFDALARDVIMAVDRIRHELSPP